MIITIVWTWLRDRWRWLVTAGAVLGLWLVYAFGLRDGRKAE